MASSFHASVILPDKVVYDNDASSLVVPAYNGYLGVLAHHAPLVANLKPGKITLRSTTGETTAFDLKSHGILEFSDNKAMILLDSL